MIPKSENIIALTLAFDIHVLIEKFNMISPKWLEVLPYIQCVHFLGQGDNLSRLMLDPQNTFGRGEFIIILKYETRKKYDLVD
jgi:hypothetical protein